MEPHTHGSILVCTGFFTQNTVVGFSCLADGPEYSQSEENRACLEGTGWSD